MLFRHHFAPIARPRFPLYFEATLVASFLSADLQAFGPDLRIELPGERVCPLCNTRALRRTISAEV